MWLRLATGSRCCVLPPLLYLAMLLTRVDVRISMPVLVILEAQLLSLERRAALLWRADRAGVLVAFVVPHLSPDDTRLQLKSLTFVATIIQCLPSDALFTSALKSVPKEGGLHQYVWCPFLCAHFPCPGCY
jgi:hypothetical protein